MKKDFPFKRVFASTQNESDEVSKKLKVSGKKKNCSKIHSLPDVGNPQEQYRRKLMFPPAGVISNHIMSHDVKAKIQKKI